MTGGSILDLTDVVRRTTRKLVRALGAECAWRLTARRDQPVPVAGDHVPKELVGPLSAPAVLA